MKKIISVILLIVLCMSASVVSYAMPQTHSDAQGVVFEGTLTLININAPYPEQKVVLKLDTPVSFSYIPHRGSNSYVNGVTEVQLDTPFLSEDYNNARVSVGIYSEIHQAFSESHVADYVIIEPVISKCDDKITVRVDGNEVAFDCQPVIVNGRTLVPVRAIFESLGAEVEWFDREIMSLRGETLVHMSIGSDEMWVDDDIIILEVAPLLYGDRTLVPVRAISEAFGCSVEWIADTKTVEITQ